MKPAEGTIGPANGCAGAGVSKQPEFDYQINNIGNRLADMADVINRIEGIIYVPRPICEEKCKAENPQTVSNALGRINNDITSQNERLEQIASTLNNYFGELKLD